VHFEPDQQETSIGVHWALRLLTCCLFFMALSIAAPAAPRWTLPDAKIRFDIPAQPLDEALAAFGASTGIQVFYETELAAGRRSNAVNGTFDTGTALERLLKGSGLVARVIAAGTISLTQPRETVAGAALAQAKHAAVSYYGVMQAGIMRALCAGAETRPGHYHIAMQYRVGPSGRTTQVRVIGSSGDKARDKAVSAALQGVVFVPPPQGMPQPVTITIEPAPAARLAGCTDSGQVE